MFLLHILIHHAGTCWMALLKLVWNSQRLCDCPSNIFGVVFNVLVRETQNCPSKLVKMLLALNVTVDHGIMITAVDLYDEHLFRAGELGKVRTDRMLATKLQTAQMPGPQDAPQHAFRRRQILLQSSSSGRWSWRSFMPAPFHPPVGRVGRRSGRGGFYGLLNSHENATLTSIETVRW